MMLISTWVGGSMILCLALFSAAARRTPRNDQQVSESTSFELGLSSVAPRAVAVSSSVPA
jgi:hypothetical protein